jgi:drug/metabolite transporter (DMT)-like permease
VKKSKNFLQNQVKDISITHETQIKTVAHGVPFPAKVKGSLMILISALCFGSYGLWSRLLGKNFGVFYQGWVRSAIILALLLPIAVVSRQFASIKSQDRKWFSITMIFTVFTQAPLYFAYNHLPLGTATFIFYGLFLITSYLVGWLFLSEKISTLKMFSAFLAFVGLLLTFGVSMETFQVGPMLLAALSGIASGGEVATSKKVTDTYSSLQVTTYSWILILITHLPLSILMGEDQPIPSFDLESFFMLSYAVAGLLGFWLVIEGFKYVDASIGGLLGLFEILFSALLGVCIFNDQLPFSVIIGGIIIVIAALLPDVYAMKHSKTKPVPLPPSL